MTRAELLELLKKARKQLKKYHVPKDEQTVTLSIDTIENALSEQPQIVQCKDCAYLNRDPRFMNYGYCSYFKDKFYVNVNPDKNFYCGAGKRQQ